MSAPFIIVIAYHYRYCTGVQPPRLPYLSAYLLELGSIMDIFVDAKRWMLFPLDLTPNLPSAFGGFFFPVLPYRW